MGRSVETGELVGKILKTGFFALHKYTLLLWSAELVACLLHSW